MPGSNWAILRHRSVDSPKDAKASSKMEFSSQDQLPLDILGLAAATLPLFAANVFKYNSACRLKKEWGWGVRFNNRTTRARRKEKKTGTTEVSRGKKENKGGFGGFVDF